MSTPINILFNNLSILTAVKSCKISVSGYCMALNLEISDISLCDSFTIQDNLCLKVLIGTTSYDFFLEEKERNIDLKQEFFTVWGRSKQALLDKKYSEIYTDTETSGYVWQSNSSIKASEIIDYVKGDISVTLESDDFVIYPDTFSVSGKSAIEILYQLCDEVGYELTPTAAGGLVIREYKTTSAPVATYTELDDIITVSEQIEQASGVNAITIYGYTDPESELDKDDPAGGGVGGESVSKSISVVGDSEIELGQWGYITVYYYHSETIDIVSYCNGMIQYIDTETEIITEDIDLKWGVGNTFLPNIYGKSEVTGDFELPFETKTVSYTVNKRNYKISGATEGDYKAFFYFSDKSGDAEHNYSVSKPEIVDDPPVDPEPDPFIDPEVEAILPQLCDSLVLENSHDDIIVPGSSITFLFYNPYGLPVTLSDEGIYHTGTKTKQMIETTPSYPVKSMISKNVLWTLGSKYVQTEEKFVVYTTEYTTYLYTLPANQWQKTLTLGFKAKDCLEKIAVFDVTIPSGLPPIEVETVDDEIIEVPPEDIDTGDDGGDGDINVTSSISAVLEDKTDYYIQILHHIKVYYYHSEKQYTDAQAVYGNIWQTGGSKQSYTENVTLEWGIGKTTYYDENGNNVVTGDTTIATEIKSVTYVVKYATFLYICNQEITDTMTFYFLDKSVQDTIDITLTKPLVYTVAKPEFSVAPGTYNTPQSVAITCATEGAVIHYVTNHYDDADESAPEYSGEIPVESYSNYIYARAFLNGFQSQPNGGTYTITSVPIFKIATPILSKTNKFYTEPFLLTITCVTPDAVIYYTTDGSEPSEESALYSEPIEITESCIVTAKAFREAWFPSDSVTGDYTLPEPVPEAPVPASYLSAVLEAKSEYLIDNTYYIKTYFFKSENIAIIAVAMNGTVTKVLGQAPSELIESFTETVQLSWGVGNTTKPDLDGNTAVKGDTDIPIAYKTVEYQTKYCLFSYTHDTPGEDIISFFFSDISKQNDVNIALIGKIATPVIHTPGGQYEDSININSITCDTPDAVIYYTTDGSEPSETSTLYSGQQIHITENTTLKAIAYKELYEKSDIAEQVYTIGEQEPVPMADPYLAAEGDTLVSVGETGEVRVYYYHSNNAEIEFYTDADVVYNGGGTETFTEEIELSWGVGNTSRPDLNGNTAVNGDTAKAFETKNITYQVKYNKYNISADADGDYKIVFWFADKSAELTYEFNVGAQTVANPVFNPIPEEFIVGNTITITCDTPGAVIYYSTNGTTPDENSLEYSSPVEIPTNTTLKAIGIKDLWLDSGITEGYYQTAAGVILQWTDAESGEAIVDALVDLDGNYAGTTDMYGRITFSDLIPGSYHTVKCIKIGYYDSDMDGLANDSFTA